MKNRLSVGWKPRTKPDGMSSAEWLKEVNREYPTGTARAPRGSAGNPWRG